MSLAIQAGSKATLVTTDRDADVAIGDVTVYSVGYPERLDGLPEGIYHFTGETLDFDVGGAGEYYAFLEQISEAIFGQDLESIRGNPEACIGNPFIELLNFSDNEGALGPDTSRKLARDFAAHSEVVKSFNPDSQEEPGSTARSFFERVKRSTSSLFSQAMRPELGTGGQRPQILSASRFIELYDSFQQAFELAADKGFVLFQ